MQIAAEQLDWDSNDIAALKAFLATKTGLRFLPKVCESLPGLLPAGETNAMMVRAGEVRGFQIAIQAALSLSFPAPEPAKAEPIAYPNLTDDAAWADGQTIEPKQ
jgi:hypothetical protein